MSGGWLGPATLAATLGAGLMAGFFYGFSNVVMGALGRRPAAEAVAAMQACEFVGLPECQLPLAQAVTYLACAPKSNAATVAISEAPMASAAIFAAVMASVAMEAAVMAPAAKAPTPISPPVSVPTAVESITPAVYSTT